MHLSTIKGLDLFLFACLCFVCPFTCFCVFLFFDLSCDALFGCFIFRSMLVCLDLGSSILALLHAFVFILGICVCTFGAFYLFGCIFPILWLVWMQPCGEITS